MATMSFASCKDDEEVNSINKFCPDENHPHAIDLGLPSGMLWACCNVGAKSPKPTAATTHGARRRRKTLTTGAAMLIAMAHKLPATTSETTLEAHSTTWLKSCGAVIGCCQPKNI